MHLPQIPNIVQLCVDHIIDENCILADAWTMLLSNLSRSEDIVEDIYIKLEKHMDQLVTAFTNTSYNKKKCHLNYLGECIQSTVRT